MRYVVLFVLVTCAFSDKPLEPKGIPSISTILRDELLHPLAIGRPDENPDGKSQPGTVEIPAKIEHQYSLPEIQVVDDTKTKQITPYGLWESPLDAHAATKTSFSSYDPPVRDPVTGSIFWLENQNDGRDTIFQYDEDTSYEWTPLGFDVRTEVNGYGGGAFTFCNNTLIFSNNDSALYMQHYPMEKPVNLTEVPSKRKFGDLQCVFDMWIVTAVAEDPADPESGDAIKTSQMVVFINLTTWEQKKNLYHTDFFQSPRFSPDGTKLAWIERSAPNMPWDDNTLFQASVHDGDLIAFKKMIQHGSSKMIGWTQYNEMLYIHDMSGWWNLYIINKRNQEINLTPMNADVGGPAWTLGRKVYDVNPAIGSRDVAVAVGKNLLIVNCQSLKTRKIDIEYDVIKGLTYSKDGTKIYMLAANGTEDMTLVQIDLKTYHTKQIRRKEPPIPEEYISVAHSIAFPTTQNATSYGNLYLPKNPGFSAGKASLPPLLINVHGGPTSSSTTYLNLKVQYFTSRGFAYFDLDHRGSTGYGKEYMRSLYENWGIYDVEDAISAAKYLIKELLVDEKKIGIRGGSAGGFTTLGTLTKTDLFAAGASYFGVSDLLKLYEETHFFERGYVNILVGDVIANRSEYIERSPLYNTENITSPIILFQGDKDTVVPLNQSKTMYDALVERGVPSKLVVYEGEGHGFRKPENRQDALEKELKFYLTNFQIVPTIENKTNS